MDLVGQFECRNDQPAVHFLPFRIPNAFYRVFEHIMVGLIQFAPCVVKGARPGFGNGFLQQVESRL